MQLAIALAFLAFDAKPHAPRLRILPIAPPKDVRPYEDPNPPLRVVPLRIPPSRPGSGDYTTAATADGNQ